MSTDEKSINKKKSKWIINVFDGVDKLGKTTFIDALKDRIKQDNTITVDIISNPSLEQKRKLRNQLTDSPAVDSAIFSAYITNNWIEYRQKRPISDILQRDKTVVLIDRWYSSTFAYQGVLTETDTEQMVVESFSIDKVKDFIDELSIIAKFTPDLDIYFNFFLIVSDKLELVLQGQDTNTEPLSSKYERIDYLKEVQLYFEDFIEIYEDMIDNIELPDNLYVGYEVLTYSDIRKEGFTDTIKHVYIDNLDIDTIESTPEVAIDNTWQKVIESIAEKFLPFHDIFSLRDLQLFCDTHFILLDDDDFKRLISTLEMMNLISQYDTGFAVVYYSLIPEEE